MPHSLFLLLLTGFCPLSAAVFIENFSHGRILPVVCYFEKGQAFRPTPMDYDVENVPGDLCSHVNLAYMELDNTTWTIKRDTAAMLEGFAQLKRKFPRLKTLLSIGGWTNQTKVLSAMASMQTRRTSFITNTVQLLIDGNFDGLDVFWLFPGNVVAGGSSSDKINFVSLLKELCAAFKEHKLLLTAGVPLNQSRMNAGYDIPEINKYLDWMNVIGYDLRGAWNGRTDTHSPLHPRGIDGPDVPELNVEQGLQALLDRGASKRKLVLGVAFYGRLYKLASPSNTELHAPTHPLNRPQKGAFLMSDNIHAYFEVCQNVVFGQWERGFDEEGMCPYATNKQDWVGYEDPQSIAQKVEFVRKEGYAGIMVMSCDKDDFIGVCGKQNALLETIKNGLPRLRNNIVL